MTDTNMKLCEREAHATLEELARLKAEAEQARKRLREVERLRAMMPDCTFHTGGPLHLCGCNP